MSMRQCILHILTEADIDPSARVGEQSAYEKLEAAVYGVLDEIEEAVGENPDKTPWSE